MNACLYMMDYRLCGWSSSVCFHCCGARVRFIQVYYEVPDGYSNTSEEELDQSHPIGQMLKSFAQSAKRLFLTTPVLLWCNPFQTNTRPVNVQTLSLSPLLNVEHGESKHIHTLSLNLHEMTKKLLDGQLNPAATWRPQTHENKSGHD